MTEFNKTEPVETDPEDLRRQLADIGAPLTPNVVNRGRSEHTRSQGCSSPRAVDSRTLSFQVDLPANPRGPVKRA